eukprot:CAMPEP_0177672660 /NCGR_PEP_ID=MMETSP0447-20121125/25475_1 /TAXON_ID=0 /ORGANISM="Stygamoeba regulata, Strain BSH-02190019" /LENGTH=35 /DNA_ID= /DNA_START= /DNA_END= /DNA_ORIENTATION=
MNWGNAFVDRYLNKEILKVEDLADICTAAAERGIE